MTKIITFIINHQFSLYYVTMVMIDQLPMPNGNKFYSWFFGCAHVFAANFRTMRSGFKNGYSMPTIPQQENKDAKKNPLSLN